MLTDQHIAADSLADSLAKSIRLLVLDVDGVLTDGGLYYDSTGLAMKRFDSQDGNGIKMLQGCGVEVAVISGMNAPCVKRRLEALGIGTYHGGAQYKTRLLETMRVERRLTWNEIAYVGDEWVDLAAMAKVGLPIAVANARPEVKERALYVTKASGGHGAVREVTDWILRCKGLIDSLLEEWIQRV